MKFEFLQSEEVCALALKIHQAIPEGISNLTLLGALGASAAVTLSDLFVEQGPEAVIQMLEDWTSEIALKTFMIGKLQAEGFDFEAWAVGNLPTAGEA